MKNSLIVFLILLFTSSFTSGQVYPPKNKLKISVRKMGPYFGYEQGRTQVIEIGTECLFKKIKLIKPNTHGIHLGFNYAWDESALGFETGYWFKQGRLNMTFGASAVLRTNFDETRVGLSPMMGYRLFGFHLQVGYHFLTPSSTFTNTNSFFIRLRFTLITDRKWDIDGLNFNRKKKKNK